MHHHTSILSPIVVYTCYRRSVPSRYKMCVKRYYGWLCGHRDPSATELPIQPCGPPERNPYEPLCSPPEYDLIIRVPEKNEEGEDEAPVPWEAWQEGICRACCEVYSRVGQQWSAKRVALVESDVASDGHLEIIDQRLYQRAMTMLEKGRKAGPDHTLHLAQYELEQTVILQDMERLLASVWRTKDYFRDNYQRIDNQKKLPEKFIFEYLRRYTRAELRRKELTQEETDRFAKTVRQYVKELQTALDKIALPQEAGAARQSPEADPPSGIPALYGEGEPEGEAGSSDK